MIRISDLEFCYDPSRRSARSQPSGQFRLRIPEFSVEKGTTVAVIGPSGSGKTTLLNLIAGIVAPSSGLVVTNRVEVSSLGEAARRAFRIRQVGMVFQEFELLEHLNVLDNILLPCRIDPGLRLDQPMRERAADLAEEVGIGDKLTRYVTRLSQGERQRIAVCRALLPDPPLLLCDEPTGNLDPANKDHVMDILFGYVERNGTTLLTVTHDHELLKRFTHIVDFKQFHEVSDGLVKTT